MSTYPDFEKFNLMKQEQTTASDSATPQLSKEEQTEGPWEVGDEYEIAGDNYRNVYDKDDFLVATVPSSRDDAKLIARAPELASSLSRVEGERDELRKERDELLLIVRASYQEAVNEGYISEMRFLQPTIEKYASQSTTPTKQGREMKHVTQRKRRSQQTR